MPFISQLERRALARLEDASTSGQMCYLEYQSMVVRWRRNPKWTTAHEIYKDVMRPTKCTIDGTAAKELAWQVFFQLHVMPYEIEKQKDNGDI